MKAVINRVALLVAVAAAAFYLFLASKAGSNIDINSQLVPMIVVAVEAEALYFSLALLLVVMLASENKLGILDEYRLFVCLGALVVGWMALGAMVAEFRKVG